MDMNAVPSGDPGGVAVAPGQEGVAGGQAGVVREVYPVVADADQGKAVGYQTGAGGNRRRRFRWSSRRGPGPRRPGCPALRRPAPRP